MHATKSLEVTARGYLEPRLWADSSVEHHVEFDTDSLARVGPPFRLVGSVAARLTFDVDSQGRRELNGRICGQVVATCQRCLSEVKLTVEAPLRLTFVADEAAGELVESERDFLVWADSRISLREIVEEEFLLALPMVPVHADEACERAVNQYRAPPATTRPFESLLQGESRGASKSTTRH